MSTHKIKVEGNGNAKAYLSFASLLLCLVFCCLSFVGQAQMTQDVYGKNRVQYKKFKWSYITTPNFEIYFYNDNEALARNAAQHAELEFDNVSEILGFAPYQKIRLFVYSSKADLLESNVGLDADNNLIGGRTLFSKSIIEVPYAGNQVDFRLDIRYGISRTLIYEMMYGGSFKESVQSAYFLTLPDWFLGGAALYTAYGWSSEMDDYMRDAMRNRSLRKPQNLIGEEAVMAGHSLWNYIAERYGKNNISNILNLTRLLRNEQSSIASSLGVDYDRLIKDWRTYYTLSTEQTVSTSTLLPRNQRLIKNKADYVINQTRLSSDANFLAYSLNNNGRFSIYIKDLATKRNKRITTRGLKVLSQETDDNEPLLGWVGNHTLLAIFSHKGKPHLYIYERATRKSKLRPIIGINQVSSFDVAPDGRSLLLSADVKGRTDIFLYFVTSGRVQQLTNDLADDLYPHFLPDGNKFIFSSNRINDSIPAKFEHKDISESYNLYILKVAPAQGTNARARQVTFGNGAKMQAQVFVTPSNGDTIINYISDVSGVNNIRSLSLKTGAEYPLTDFVQNINSFDYQDSTKRLYFVSRERGKDVIYARDGVVIGDAGKQEPTERAKSLQAQQFAIDLFLGINKDSSSLTNAKRNRLQAQRDLIERKKDSLNKGYVNFREYIFESEKPSLKVSAPEENRNLSSKPGIPITGSVKYPLQGIGGPFRYQNRMGINVITSTIVIDPLMNFGLHNEASISDLFENHKFNAGLTTFFNLRSNRAHMEYQYLANRLDYRLRYSRTSYYFNSDNLQVSQRYILGKLEGTLAYPLGNASVVTAGPTFMQTRFVRIFDGQISSLEAPDVYNRYLGYKLEYNFDNTVSQGMNMKEGMRLRARLEYNRNAGNNAMSFSSINLDFRRYQKIHKEIVFAIRGSYGRFFGNDPKSFMLGGMDNWLFNNSEVSSLRGDPLAENSLQNGRTDRLFNQYVTNMRGFDYNAQFGQNYLLFNAELRLPLVRYFYKGPIESAFLKNFQIVAFYDMGSAWTGANPLSGANSVNSRTIGGGPSDPFLITYRNFNDPFLRAYGLGIRSMMLGYYTKIDVAQGFKNGIAQSPTLFLSLGYDF